jgi:N,N'-diacetyl-8-epilegionaminate cytidylyltransferase
MSSSGNRPNVVGFVFARGGSKGIPRKNLRLLAGRPLLAHAIEAASASRWIRDVLVSTDDEEIARVAERYGARVPFLRPSELASDDCPELRAWQHAIHTVNQDPRLPAVDVFVSVPTTAPLRSAADVDACIDEFMAFAPDVVVSVSPAHRSPCFNMVTVGPDGLARLVIPGGGVARRQDAPAVFDMTTVAYVARPEFVLATESLFSGRMRAVVVPRERALDVDTEFDIELAEWLLSRQQGQSMETLRRAGYPPLTATAVHSSRPGNQRIHHNGRLIENPSCVTAMAVGRSSSSSSPTAPSLPPTWTASESTL